MFEELQIFCFMASKVLSEASEMLTTFTGHLDFEITPSI